LKDTVQNDWINSASNLLNPEKIYYSDKDGNLESKIDRVRRIHPEKELYFYGNSICYLARQDDMQGSLFKFLDSDKEYAIPLHKLQSFPK
jgi:hypothetical protein